VTDRIPAIRIVWIIVWIFVLLFAKRSLPAQTGATPQEPSRSERAETELSLARADHIVASLGQREVILPSGQQGLKYFPDGCLAFVRTAPPYRVLLTAGISTWLLEGPQVGSLVSLGEVLRRGPPGSFDNGYAGVGGIARHPATGELLAFYHAEDQENMPAIGGGIPGFYCSVGLAVSNDDGASFHKRGPVVTGRFPKDLHGRADQGCGDLCVVADKENRFLRIYYCDHSRVDRRGVQICLARCRLENADRTDGWRKYDRGAFDEPGLGGKETPVVSAQALPGDAIFPQVAFLKQLNCYVMVFSIVAYRELAAGTKPEQGGIYMASSQDGISWSKPTQLLAIPCIARLGQPVGWHPTLLVSSVAGNTAKGWLYYAYSESWGHKPPQVPHYLVGQPIAFSIE
jgi:hypothetical protein